MAEGAWVNSNGKVYNEEQSAWEDGWGGSIPEPAVGTDYTLGSGAATNKGGTISVKCLSTDGETAIMQTYGVTAGAWPSSGDLTASYTSFWGSLSSAISGVKLPTGSSSSNINPSGSYAVLQSAAGAYSSFGAGTNHAWLGTSRSSGYACNVRSDGNVSSVSTSYSYVCAPYFTLDLTKVKINVDYTIVAK